MKAKLTCFGFRAFLVVSFIFVALYGGYVIGYTLATGWLTYELAVVAPCIIGLLMYIWYLKKQNRLRVW